MSRSPQAGSSKKENMLVTNIFSFSCNVFKRVPPHDHQQRIRCFSRYNSTLPLELLPLEFLLPEDSFLSSDFSSSLVDSLTDSETFDMSVSVTSSFFELEVDCLEGGSSTQVKIKKYVSFHTAFTFYQTTKTNKQIDLDIFNSLDRLRHSDIKKSSSFEFEHFNTVTLDLYPFPDDKEF